MRHIANLAASVAVATASMVVMTGVVPASAAPQQSPGVSLSIKDDPANPANYLLWIQGKFPMSEGAAYDRLDNLAPGGGMDYIVFADDPGDADARIGMPHGYIGRPGPAGGGVLATPGGLAFYRQDQRAQKRPQRGRLLHFGMRRRRD